MPYDFSNATTTVTDPVTGRPVVNRSRLQGYLDQIATALNGFSGTVTFDPATVAFETKTAAEAASITGAGTTVNAIVIRGYSAAGDGGAGLYTHVASQPSHDGWLQTADNEYWELAFTGRHDYRQFGAGDTAVNSALDFVGTKGGGDVVVPEDMTFSASISVPANTRLVVPTGVTMTLDTSVTTAIDLGTDTDRPGLHLAGTLALGGNASYGVKCAGSQHAYVGGWGEITGWKNGVHLASSPGQALKRPRVHGLVLGAPHSSSVVYPLRITCEPNLGYDMVDEVDIDGVVCEDATPGSYSAANAQTADQVVLQGVVGGRVRNVTSRNGGENGLTIEFGSRDIDVEDVTATGCDGQGMTATGANYRIDVSGVSGTFQVGETITGGTSGATANIQYLVGTVIWVDGPSYEKFSDGENITGGSSLATATVSEVHNVRNIRIHDSVRTSGNGINAASAVGTFAGVYVHHCRDVYVGGVHVENDDVGVLIGESTYCILPGLHVPVGSTQTSSITVADASSTPVGPMSIEGDGSTTVLWLDNAGRVVFGPNLQQQPASRSTADAGNTGVCVNTIGQLEACYNGNIAVLTNRTGSLTAKLGPTVDVRKDGTSVAYIGTAGHKFPSFAKAAVPDATSHAGAEIWVTDATGGAGHFRSDGMDWKRITTEGATLA